MKNKNEYLHIVEAKEKINLDYLVNINFIYGYKDLVRLNDNNNGFKNGLVVLIPIFLENPSITIINKYETYNKPGEHIIYSGENAIINLTFLSIRKIKLIITGII